MTILPKQAEYEILPRSIGAHRKYPYSADGRPFTIELLRKDRRAAVTVDLATVEAMVARAYQNKQGQAERDLSYRVILKPQSAEAKPAEAKPAVGRTMNAEETIDILSRVPRDTPVMASDGRLTQVRTTCVGGTKQDHCNFVVILSARGVIGEIS